MKKWHYAATAALGLVASGALAWQFDAFGRSAPEAMTLYGNVDVREVDLGFRVGGRIETIAVEEGERVQAGQNLAILEQAPLAARIAQADAAVSNARAVLARLENGARPDELQQARAREAIARAERDVALQEMDRRRDLLAPGAISQQLWERTVGAHDAAQARLSDAQAALALVRDGPRAEDIAAAKAALEGAEAARLAVAVDRDDTRLVAPAEGVIATRVREPGATVQPTQTVLTLALDRPMKVRAYVAGPDLWRVVPGMAVKISADGNPLTYAGTIGSIASRAEFTPRTVETPDLRTDLVYQVRIIVRDPDNALRQGQPVTVTIPRARAVAADAGK